MTYTVCAEISIKCFFSVFLVLLKLLPIVPYVRENGCKKEQCFMDESDDTEYIIGDVSL